MNARDVEAAGLQLPVEERIRVAETLLASVPRKSASSNGTTAEHRDTAATPESAQEGSYPPVGTGRLGIVVTPPKRERSIWEMGKNPVDAGPPDASVNHDKYLYGDPD